MTLEAHIICWNEMAIAPFVMQYWRAAGVDRLVVHDNCSTDGVTDYLRQFPFVQIDTYNSGGQLDDYRLQSVKNNCWKGSDADWVFVGDFDEVPYHPWGLRNILSAWKHLPIIQACGYQTVAWAMPRVQNPYDSLPPLLLHQMPGVRLVPLGPNKTQFFQPQLVKEMNWGLGAHHCDPVGALPKYVPDISWLHLKNLGVEYLLQRNATLYARLPEKVRQEQKIAVHYLPGTDVFNVSQDLAGMWSVAQTAQQLNL